MSSAEDCPEGDLEVIWNNLLFFLCQSYEKKAKNHDTVDYLIEDLRSEKFGAFTDKKHFGVCLEELARRHEEIETRDGIIRLTEVGIIHCGKHGFTPQEDSKLDS